jgi:hypothetical protein
MPIKTIPLFLLLTLGWSQSSNAQLFPVGTKLHVAQLVSSLEPQTQRYLPTIIDTGYVLGHLYTLLDYPGWNASSYILRLDSNKLYTPNLDDELLLFDFNAKTNDTLTIYQSYYSLPNSDGEKLGLAHIKIDSITYEYFFNELNIRDSLKTFWYSGNLESLPWPWQEDPTLPKSFRYRITEKIIQLYTASRGSYLGVNIGPRTLSDDHERLRCVEFPDGRMIKMEWWYQMAGNTIPCDYTFNLANEELGPAPSINVFPNPADGQFTLTNYTGTVSLYNQLGQHIFTKTVDAGNPFDISNLPSGIYYLQTENGQHFQLAIK